MKSRRVAIGWCALAEGSTLLGGAAGLWMAPHLGTGWITYPLGLTAGIRIGGSGSGGGSGATPGGDVGEVSLRNAGRASAILRR